MNYPPKKTIKGVEVRGEVIIGLISAMKSLYLPPDKYLTKYDIEKPQEKQWYPLEAVTRVFADLEKEGLFLLLQRIGTYVADNAVWPKNLKSFEEALSSIDHAYHMNHRRDGKELYDYAHNQPFEGFIGHDYIETDYQNKKAVYVCGSFYSCDFDFGMARAVARKFKPESSAIVNIVHDDSKPCRKKGGDTCTYIFSW